MSSRRSTATGDPEQLPTTTVHVRSLKADDDEESKEQPAPISSAQRPHHSRPPSIRIQHQRNASAANASLGVTSPVSPPQSSGSLPSSARSSLRGLFGRHGKKASVAPLTPSPLLPFDASAASGTPKTPRSAPPQPSDEKEAAPHAPQQAEQAEEKEATDRATWRRGKHRSTASVAWLNRVKAGELVELTAQSDGAASADAVSPFSAQTVEEESEDDVNEEGGEEEDEDAEPARQGRGDELRERGKSLSTVARKQAPATIVVEADDERQEEDEHVVDEEREQQPANGSEREQKPSGGPLLQPQFEHKYDDADEHNGRDVAPSLAAHEPASPDATVDTIVDHFSSYTIPPPASLSALSAHLPPALLALLDQLRTASPFDASESELSSSDRHVVHLERLSVAAVKDAERRREERRLEERRAVLREWKEREWRVWKEERRVHRLLNHEHDHQRADVRQAEERVWTRQNQRVVGERATFDEHEQAVITKLHSSADITVTALPSPNSSQAPVSLVDPTASFVTFPSLHRRYHVHYRHAPRLLSLHIHALRSVKDKLAAGQYHIRVALYDRLGGRRLAWTRDGQPGGGSVGQQRRECGGASVMTREAVRHGGGWWEQEMLFAQPANQLLLACPADVDSHPSMILLFELLMVSESAGASTAPVVAWGAFPLSSFASGSTEPVAAADTTAAAAIISATSASSSSAPSTLSPPTSAVAAPPSLPFSQSTVPSTAPPAPSVLCALVSGHHRLPLLVGPYDPSIRTWHELHRRIADDLSVWLCNLYFHARDGAERVEQERDYCVEVKLGRRQRAQTATEADMDEQYVLLPPTEDGEIGERKRKRNRPLHAHDKANSPSSPTTATSLMTRRLAHMDLAHSELVQQVRSRDGVSADDMSDPFAVWPEKDEEGWRWLDVGDSMDAGEGWKGGEASYDERQLAITLRTRKRKRNLAANDNSMNASSSDYQLAVATPTFLPSSPSQPVLSALKLRYVWGHLDTVYNISHPLSWPFLFLASLMVLTLWARLFLHYFTQYVFLSTALSSSSSLSFDCSYLGCSVDYDETLSVATFLLLCILGSVTPLVLLLLLCPLPSLYRRLTRRSPPLLADTLLLCFATCLIVDPFLVDNTGLYDADTITTVLVLLLSLSFAVVAGLTAYLYLVYLHVDGAVLDTWQRHQPAALVDALYCVPRDYCMPIEELLAVIAASRQWRGELGERRRVRVKDRGDGQATYVSIVVVAGEDDREAEAEVYRQFVLLRDHQGDGDVYELFDTRDITQQLQLNAAGDAANTASAAGGDAVPPAAADAYLARLLKGRGKVLPRSGRQLWTIARKHFNFSRSRASSSIGGANTRSSFIRSGTTARMSTMPRNVRSTSMAGSFSGVSAPNRMGTFGQF